MLVQTSVGIIETYFVGWFGTDALAGDALVFPVLMLMQMMSAGARALGAGRRTAFRLSDAAARGLAPATALRSWYRRTLER
jgi:Na+-driven multidrug efflux pump